MEFKTLGAPTLSRPSHCLVSFVQQQELEQQQTQPKQDKEQLQKNHIRGTERLESVQHYSKSKKYD